MPYEPPWFASGRVVISNAPTCGLNKDGAEQHLVDPATGVRSETEIDDQLLEDATALARGDPATGHVSVRPLDAIVASRVLVPRYHDRSTVEAFEAFVNTLPKCRSTALGDLVAEGLVRLWSGHGSPAADQRLGTVPYIKVSDLRGGRVNVNPTNRVPSALARSLWGGSSSGLEAYDLLSPARASKNIGEFCVLMPGQENLVLTKEIFVLRATKAAPFDQFFLMWALSLSVVRAQWDRLVLMQTNREDVGDRALELRLPLPQSRSTADELSKPFRDYASGLADLTRTFSTRLARSRFRHHGF